MTWFADRSVRTKILSALGVAAVVTGVVAGLGVASLATANDAMKKVTAKNAHFAALADARDAMSDTLGAVDADGQKKADAFLDQSITEYGRLNEGNAAREQQTQIFRDAMTKYRGVRDDEEGPAARSGNTPLYLQLHATKALPAIAVAQAALGELQTSEFAEAEAWTSAARDDYGTSRTLILVAVAVGLLASFAIGLWTTRLIVRPLRRVADVLGAVAEGDLAVRVEVQSKDEVGAMAGALNRATESMRVTVAAMDETASALAASSSELTDVSGQIAAGTDEASSQAGVVAAAASQVSRNVQTVAAGTDEMGTSIREIAQNASDAAKVASQAVMAAESTTHAVGRLGESSTEIGNVVKVITSIAEQTNLLALNATIEAARAGEAGKGFAVVANEVKDLAQETARATEDISRRVEAIQSDTTSAVTAIGEISQIIARINDYQLTIASAVEEQTATTNEMSRSVTEAAAGSAEIANNVSGVAQATQNAAHSVSGAQRAAADLARMSSEMRTLVARFKI